RQGNWRQLCYFLFAGHRVSLIPGVPQLVLGSNGPLSRVGVRPDRDLLGDPKPRHAGNAPSRSRTEPGHFVETVPLTAAIEVLSFPIHPSPRTLVRQSRRERRLVIRGQSPERT